MYVDDPTRLHHIIDAATRAVHHASGKTREDLDKDDLLVQGLVRYVEIVGEAAKQTSRNLRDAHQEIEWRKLIDLRNELIHHYFTVDLDVLWTTVTAYLPGVIPLVQKVLDGLEGRSGAS